MSKTRLFATSVATVIAAAVVAVATAAPRVRW